ncbi:sugar porter family MFS transporter [Bifidobacterium callitrichos]|uniref:sugar porter family MFS transporter n=1 Tax=Bifidobacterium callitrichos TaxID=762209 RepID=UPI001CC29451|nr:sugar porter family MFS transporter [Bifidobacterium callitrichos]
MGTTIRTQGSGKYTFGLALSAGLAGLLYGYDTVSISGAIEFLRAKYSLDTVMEGLVISSIMIGAIIGAATAGFLSDRFGRKKILIIGGVLFFVSAVWSALTFGPITLIAARIVGGFGIGLTAALAVTYITESAPTNIRGLLSFSYQMLAVCGIFLTNVINYVIASYGTNHWDVETGWRWMLGLGAVPAVAFLAAMLRAPESPRFLIQIGRVDEGFEVLEHILGTERARLRTDDISASVKLENEMSKEFHDLFRPGLIKALIIGIFLAVFNQFVGMSAISYYGPVMFADMGFGGDTEFLASASVGGIELVFTVVGMYLIDTFGRKRLMAIGTGLMCLFALCISASYATDSSLLTLVFVMMFAASFAFSMGPIPWIVIPELFPTYLRGRATGLCVTCLLFANFVIAQFTPMMIDGLGGGVSFAIFGILDLIGLAGIVTIVPETMGRTLEEIEHLWQPNTELAAAKYALSSADANIRHAEATMMRVENERLQAMGIMAAAERARVAAQKKIFEIEMEERSKAERRSAERVAEEARQAAHTRGAESLDASLAARGESAENADIASGIRRMKPNGVGRSDNAYLHESQLHGESEETVTSHSIAMADGGNAAGGFGDSGEIGVSVDSGDSSDSSDLDDLDESSEAGMTKSRTPDSLKTTGATSASTDATGYGTDGTADDRAVSLAEDGRGNAVRDRDVDHDTDHDTDRAAETQGRSSRENQGDRNQHEEHEDDADTATHRDARIEIPDIAPEGMGSGRSGRRIDRVDPSDGRDTGRTTGHNTERNTGLNESHDGGNGAERRAERREPRVLEYGEAIPNRPITPDPELSRGVLLPREADIHPVEASNPTGVSASEEERESAAIDRALDSLDALIKA